MLLGGWDPSSPITLLLATWIGFYLDNENNAFVFGEIDDERKANVFYD